MTTTSVSATSGSALVDGVDVDAVAAAVRSCSGVDDLYSSSSQTVASYLPGRQIAGIRVVGDSAVTIQVRSVWAVPFEQVAAQIRAAAGPLCGGRQIDVVFGDIADPITAPPAPPVLRSAATPPAAAPGAAPAGPEPSAVKPDVASTTPQPVQPAQPTFGPAFAPPLPPPTGPAAAPPTSTANSASKSAPNQS